MSTYIFETTQVLPVPVSEAWDFFSAPQNLARITPPELSFSMLTNSDNRDIYKGMKIDYTLKPLLGIRVHWQTLIAHVDKPHQFTDTQAKGPYRLWEHTHTFQPHEKGTSMHDRVVYQLPFGWIGRMAHRLMVRQKIRRIFAYRRTTLETIFNSTV